MDAFHAVYDEIVCYLLAEKLPAEMYLLSGEMVIFAHNSAQRLYRQCNKDTETLLDLLKEAIRNPGHRLIQKVEQESAINWSTQPYWGFLQYYFRDLIIELELLAITKG